QPQTFFRAPRHFDAQRRGKRSVETHAEAVVALQPVEIEIRLARGDLSSIVEERGVDEAVDHDAPLRLKSQRILVAEAVAGEPSQRGSTAYVRQHEERNLLIALAVCRARDATERNDPGFTQDRKVLNRFVVDLVEAEPLVP